MRPDCSQLRSYLFEFPVHVEVVSLCQVTLYQIRRAPRARINQAAIIVVFVRFNPPNDDFTVCVVVAELVKGIRYKLINMLIC